VRRRGFPLCEMAAPDSDSGPGNYVKPSYHLCVLACTPIQPRHSLQNAGPLNSESSDLMESGARGVEETDILIAQTCALAQIRF